MRQEDVIERGEGVILGELYEETGHGRTIETKLHLEVPTV